MQPIGILKDTPVGYSTLCMQRREDIYPPVSSGFPAIDTFAPQRWETWTPKSWTYVFMPLDRGDGMSYHSH
jgi:hypothetical protein